MATDISIDGSQGEGGGQILRSSLSLALATGRSFTIEHIRANRKKPGLMRQHLTAVNAAAAISGSEVQGAEPHSQWLSFKPGQVQGGDYHFTLGTAGSATLVFQTLLPALLVADRPSRLVLEGGTHNPWAPPFDFLARAFLPLVNRMGPKVTVELDRYGFYPAGGGRFTATVEPSSALAGFDLLEPGPLISRRVTALLANLPDHIAEREVNTALKNLSWAPSCGRVALVDAAGPGNIVMVELESEHVTEIFTSFGRLGVRAEQVAREAAKQAAEYLHSGVPVGDCLADQLLLPLGLSAAQSEQGSVRRGGSFRTLRPSQHTLTHIDILKHFLEIDVRIDDIQDDGTCRMNVLPAKPG